MCRPGPQISFGPLEYWKWLHSLLWHQCGFQNQLDWVYYLGESAHRPSSRQWGLRGYLLLPVLHGYSNLSTYQHEHGLTRAENYNSGSEVTFSRSLVRGWNGLGPRSFDYWFHVSIIPSPSRMVLLQSCWEHRLSSAEPSGGPLQKSFLSLEMTERCYSLWTRTCYHATIADLEPTTDG